MPTIASVSAGSGCAISMKSGRLSLKWTHSKNVQTKPASTVTYETSLFMNVSPPVKFVQVASTIGTAVQLDVLVVPVQIVTVGGVT